MNLTNRQSDVLAFIRDHLIREQCTPTVREICENFGVSSPTGARCHLEALEKKGVIERRHGENRNIRLLGVKIKIVRMRVV